MKRDVAILGATGLVGQKTIALLSRESDLRIAELVSSKVGSKFGSACDWREILMNLTYDIANKAICSVDNVQSDLVISCLTADAAKKMESELAERGKMVFSNASAFRMNEHVPIIIPEINLPHLSLIHQQKTPGKIITNPNCIVASTALALAPLMSLGKINHVSVVTMQSVSGAGYPGESSIDILGNTIPHIEGETEKIEMETNKILGKIGIPSNITFSIHVHRVPVVHGHTATIHVAFDTEINIHQAIDSYMAWNMRHPECFVIHKTEGRPQVARDLLADDMRIHLGHMQVTANKHGSVLGFVALSHNMVRGAAGAVIGNLKSYLEWSKDNA